MLFISANGYKIMLTSIELFGLHEYSFIGKRTVFAGNQSNFVVLDAFFYFVSYFSCRCIIIILDKISRKTPFEFLGVVQYVRLDLVGYLLPLDWIV